MSLLTVVQGVGCCLWFIKSSHLTWLEIEPDVGTWGRQIAEIQGKAETDSLLIELSPGLKDATRKGTRQK